MPKSELLSKEDYWAIWIGALILLLGLVMFFVNPPTETSGDYTILQQRLEMEETRAPYKTMLWYQINDEQRNIKASNQPIGKLLRKLTGKPGTWTENPLKSFVVTEKMAAVERAKAEPAYESALSIAKDAESTAILSERFAADKNYEDATMNNVASAAIEEWHQQKEKVSKLEAKLKTKAANKLPYLVFWFLILAVLFGIGLQVMGTPFKHFASGFTIVFLIGVLAYFIAGQSDIKAMGLGYALWAIVLGLLVSNTIGIPEWLKPALATEFYIKTGLVLLGAEILMGKILAIGLPGLFVAWVVTPVVLVTTFWFGQKVLKISSKTLNMTISADMSVCGVSAAVATAAACKASKEELTLAVGLSMIFTSVMMVVMPLFINWVGIPEILGGAWMGGTIDATGAVVAAGAFLGDKALNVAATIKMIQNVLIGVIAFGVAFYFATKVERQENVAIGKAEIWRRFPKFILGFIGASILFSVIYSILGPGQAYSMIDQGVIGGFTKNVRGWLFCLAFVSIGLSTNFKSLRKHFVGGKPLILYLCGQLFNLALTLLMAYIMFYLVFPGITANI